MSLTYWRRIHHLYYSFFQFIYINPILEVLTVQAVPVTAATTSAPLAGKQVVTACMFVALPDNACHVPVIEEAMELSFPELTMSDQDCCRDSAGVVGVVEGDNILITEETTPPVSRITQ